MSQIIEKIKDNKIKIKNKLNNANIVTFKHIINTIVKNDINVLKENNINTNNYSKIIEFN